MMKVFFENGGGLGAVILQAQSQTEVERLARMVGATLVCAAYPSGSHYQIKIMPDLKALMNPQQTPYDTMAVDDMMTVAAQKGIPVKRNVIKSDLKDILTTADTDIEAAREMAKQARPAVSTKRKNDRQELPNGSGVMQTRNE